MPTRLSPKQKIKSYTIKEVLNEGAFANAYQALDSTGKNVFFKQYKSPTVRVGWYKAYVKYQQQLKQCVEENEGLAKLTYRFLDFFESRDAGQNCFYQVFEFVSGGCDLREHLNNPRITWNQRVYFARRLMFLIKFFHKAGIIHTDLKPENLYLIPNTGLAIGYDMKVIDLDQAILKNEMAPWDKRNKISGDNPRPYAGTPGYMSPEHIRGETPIDASDVFTCGLILYELLSKQGNPYGVAEDDDYNEMVLKHAAPKPTLIQSFGSADADAAVGDILWRCLDPDPAKRPTAAEVNEVLKPGTTASSRHLEPKPEPKPESKPEIKLKPEVKPEIKLKPEVKRHSLTLRSSDGKEETINLETQIGWRFMQQFGEDAKYYSTLQYTLFKENGEWYVVPNMKAKNDTIYNDSLLTGKKKLSSGDRLAVGKQGTDIKKIELSLIF